MKAFIGFMTISILLVLPGLVLACPTTKNQCYVDCHRKHAALSRGNHKCARGCPHKVYQCKEEARDCGNQVTSKPTIKKKTANN